MSIYKLSVETINGGTQLLAEYKGKVLLIVNTASRCGFTPQYKELQELYEQYRDKGFEVLAFPCNQFLQQEPGTDDEIQSFCEMTYGVTFPLFKKIDVNGKGAHPLFQFLAAQSRGILHSKQIKWNFTKFLVDRGGTVIKRFGPSTPPSKLSADIDILVSS
ncbi:MAG: glutathione peroxidase [Bacilli bacterium]|nr:glutathione peroxidase [Bacilli bacterium]